MYYIFPRLDVDRASSRAPHLYNSQPFNAQPSAIETTKIQAADVCNADAKNATINVQGMPRTTKYTPIRSYFPGRKNSPQTITAMGTRQRAP